MFWINKILWESDSFPVCHLNLWTAVLFIVIIINIIIVIVATRKHLSTTMQDVVQRQSRDTI